MIGWDIDIDIDNIVAIKILLTSLSKAIDIADPPWPSLVLVLSTFIIDNTVSILHSYE